jgi:hypothetical protein
MPSIRIFLAVLTCLTPPVAQAWQPPTPVQVPPTAATPPADAPAPPPATGQPQAEARLNYAIVQVRVMERIAARIDMDVDMLNQKFKMDGNYYKDTGNRIRLQLNLVGLGDTDSKMLQVCDGKILWDFQQVLSMQSYRKREIVPILKKLEDPGLDANFRIMITSNMGFGGPEAMLTGLAKVIGFDQIAPEKLDGVDVVVIRGTWRDRTNLLGPNERGLPPTAPLPAYIPANVAIYLGTNDGWPYKIEMIGRAPLLMEETREIDKATGRPIGRPIKPPKVDPTKITLRYKLLPMTEITPGLFNFEPPANVAATAIEDDTEKFLAGLDQYIQMELQRKKAEAAKAEAEPPLLKAKPIDVPSSPTGEGLGATPGPGTEGVAPR